MIATTHRQARILFVLSKDFGCLGMALAFLQDQEFADRAFLLLPAPIHDVNKGSLPARSAAYASLSDLQAAVDTHGPDIVVLISAYLFANDGLLSDEDLDTFVRQLRQQGCQIVTADPFVGLAPQLRRSDLDSRLLFIKKTRRERVIGRYQFWRSRDQKVVTTRALEDAVHIYPTPPGAIDSASGPHRVAFFNRQLVRPYDVSHRGLSGRDPLASPATWLFIISSTDLGVQDWLLGASAFDRLLGKTLRRAVEVGRRPIVIAPSTLIGRLESERPASPDVELIAWCGYEAYVARLLAAEYVFYWNAFSFSLFVRLSQGLPAFFFDQGHLPRVIKPYYEVARRLYYDRWSPPYLNQRRQLEPARLALLAEQQKPELAALVEYWSSSPSPAAVVDALLERRSSSRPSDGAR